MQIGPDTIETLIAAQPLLVLALLALIVSMSGALIARAAPRLGGLIRRIGSIGIVAVLIFTILDVSRLNPGFDFSRSLNMPQIGMPQQVVEGGETRVPMAHDGHFWLDATVNGTKTRFLVDTGASLTAISTDVANASGLEPSKMRGTVALQTANGTAPAQLTTVEELRVGNIVARDIDAVVAPTMAGMNVVGMNFLSRLESWSVKNGELILVPKPSEAS